MRTRLFAMQRDKRSWYDQGGFRNSRLFRRHQKGRGWQYFKTFV